MAVTSRSFGADVNSWVLATQERLTAVFQSSAQEVISEMQKPRSEGGNMRIDTGFLRSSMQVTVNGGAVPASQPNPNPNGTFAYNAQAASLVIAGAEIGDTITASYSANYAPFREYGTSGQGPDGFVRLAAVQWQVIVQHQTVRAMLTVAANRRKAA
jgi:hypothetical protein